MDERTARRLLVTAARRLDAAGLNHNSAGNLSLRFGAGALVTPSGIPADELSDDDPVTLDADGAPTGAGQRVPTSEWRLHIEILRRRPDVMAIVHTHSPEATAASTLGSALPALHYVVARFGAADLPCAAYATYGTPELARNVADTLGARARACLMANHGAIAIAGDLDDAVALAIDVEWFCGVVRRARQHGAPLPLPPDEIDRVADLFETYGQPEG